MTVREEIAKVSAEVEPISAFRINEKSVVPIWIQIRKRLVYLISAGTLKAH